MRSLALAEVTTARREPDGRIITRPLRERLADQRVAAVVCSSKIDTMTYTRLVQP